MDNYKKSIIFALEGEDRRHLNKIKRTFAFVFGLHYLCIENEKRKEQIMARPIKETPILFGEDARRFEERMKQKRRESPEERKRRLEDYHLILSMLKV